MSAQVKEDHRSEDEAKAQLESIKEMVERLEHCQNCEDWDNRESCGLSDAEIYGGINQYWKEGDIATDEERIQYHNEEDAQQAINEDPLSVEVRSDWYTPGSSDADSKPAEYMILLCTGGPACRIIGQLDQYGQPETAKIEHQDWFTPWTEYRVDSDDEAAMVKYASCFYFGD